MALNVRQLTVLTAVQAGAADVTMAQGNVTVTGLGKAIKLSDGIDYTITNYAAGTAFVKRADFTTSTLAASTPYSLSIEFPDALAFPNGGQEANQLSRIRTYSLYSGTSAPTATALAEQFRDLINADIYSKVTATAALGVLTMTQKATSLANFDGDSVIDLGGTQGATASTPTPYVAPAGTPTVLEREGVPVSLISAAGTYRKYDLTLRYPTTNGVANGAKGFVEARAVIYANEADGDFAAFNTKLTTILDGTYATVAEFLGFGM